MSNRSDKDVAQQASEIAVKGVAGWVMDFGGTEDQGVAVQTAMQFALMEDFGSARTTLLASGFDEEFVAEFNRKLHSEFRKVA